MINTPDRLAAVVESVEKGEPVDWKKLQLLGAIDMVRAGRQFVVEAIEFQEKQDDELKQNLGGTRGA